MVGGESPRLMSMRWRGEFGYYCYIAFVPEGIEVETAVDFGIYKYRQLTRPRCQMVLKSQRSSMTFGRRHGWVMRQGCLGCGAKRCHHGGTTGSITARGYSNVDITVRGHVVAWVGFLVIGIRGAAVVDLTLRLLFTLTWSSPATSHHFVVVRVLRDKREKR